MERISKLKLAAMAAVALCGAVATAIVALTGTPAAEGTSVPLPLVAIDTNVSGNSANHLPNGSIQACNTIANLGDTLDIDIVVKGVPPFKPGTRTDGLRGYRVSLHYNPAVLNFSFSDGYNPDGFVNMNGATGTKSNQLLKVGFLGKFQVTDEDLGENFESGDGVLGRFRFQAVGAGTSPLTMTWDGTGSADHPLIDDAAKNNYSITTVSSGQIVVGGSCPPTATPTPTPSPSPSPTRTPTPTPSPTPTVLKQGDLNCDGSIDGGDALRPMRLIAGVPMPLVGGCLVLGSGTPPFGDVDCDGSVGVLDGLLILESTGGASIRPTPHPGCTPIGQPLPR